MSRILLLLIVAIALLSPQSSAWAVEPDEILADAKLEARAREISHELRCLVCQNQSIDDSNAPLAKDLRVLVRKRLVAGETDQQVIDFVVARYGEFVLLNPRFALHTLILWLAAPVLLIGSTLIIFFAYRRRAKQGAGPAAASLTPAEQSRLEKFLQDG